MIFAGYYIRAFDWSIATADSYLLRGLNTAECTVCTEHIAAIDGVQAAHQQIKGGRTTILSGEIRQGTSKVKADVFIEVKTRQAAGKILNADGSVARKISADKGSSIFFLRWQSGGWKVVTIGNAS